MLGLAQIMDRDSDRPFKPYPITTMSVPQPYSTGPSPYYTPYHPQLSTTSSSMNVPVSSQAAMFNPEQGQLPYPMSLHHTQGSYMDLSNSVKREPLEYFGMIPPAHGSHSGNRGSNSLPPAAISPTLDDSRDSRPVASPEPALSVGSQDKSPGESGEGNNSNSGEDGDSKRPPKKRQISPEESSDPSYWEKRRKNNESAKRSRDARRQKEEQIALRVVYLEQENLQLRTEVSLMKSEIEKLRCMLYQ